MHVQECHSKGNWTWNVHSPLRESVFQLRSWTQLSQNMLLGDMGWLKSRRVELLWLCILLIDGVFMYFEGKKYFSVQVVFLLGFIPVNTTPTSFSVILQFTFFLKMSPKVLSCQIVLVCWPTLYLSAAKSSKVIFQVTCDVNCDINCIPLHFSSSNTFSGIVIW